MMTREQAEKNIAAVIRNAVAEEREACLKIVTDLKDRCYFDNNRGTACFAIQACDLIEAEIRARGEKSPIPTDDPL